MVPVLLLAVVPVLLLSRVPALLLAVVPALLLAVVPVPASPPMAFGAARCPRVWAMPDTTPPTYPAASSVVVAGSVARAAAATAGGLLRILGGVLLNLRAPDLRLRAWLSVLPRRPRHCLQCRWRW